MSIPTLLDVLAQEEGEDDDWDRPERDRDYGDSGPDEPREPPSPVERTDRSAELPDHGVEPTREHPLGDYAGALKEFIDAMNERLNDMLESLGYERITTWRDEVEKLYQTWDVMHGGQIETTLKSFGTGNGLLSGSTGDRSNDYTLGKDLKFTVPDWIGLYLYASERGMTVTSGAWGKHNKGSQHYHGRAIDVRSRGVSKEQINRFMFNARMQGLYVKDERTRPPGQKVWGGPHLHVQTVRPSRPSERWGTPGVRRASPDGSSATRINTGIRDFQGRRGEHPSIRSIGPVLLP